MVETITPVVHGGRGRWIGAVVLHVAGATLTAAVFGALLGGVGLLLGAPFGRAGLGVGFLTYLSTGVLVVVAVAALLGGDPRLGAVLMVPFGLARGLSATIAANVRSSEDGLRLVDRLSARPDALRRAASSAALTAVAGFAIVEAGRSGGGWGSFSLALVAGLFAWAAIWKIAARRRWWQT